METNFKPGDIVYSTEHQYTDCGLIIIHRGAIAKVIVVGEMTMEVYKSPAHKKNQLINVVKKSLMSKDLPGLKEAFECGKRNIFEI